MTDEEMIANEISDTCKEVISLIEQEVKKARQEKCFEQNKDGTIRPCEVMKENITLVKENVKLLDKLNLQNQRLNELKKENEELKEKHESNKRALKLIVEKGVKLEKENEELKTQIEKIKCCYNCKYGRMYFVNEIIVDCLANKVNPNNKYENCDKWELAE